MINNSLKTTLAFILMLCVCACAKKEITSTQEAKNNKDTQVENASHETGQNELHEAPDDKKISEFHSLIDRSGDTKILKDKLKGLRQATTDDYKAMNDIVLDGSIPTYYASGEEVKMTDIMGLLMSGKYIDDMYFDKDNKLAAIVMRKMTQEQLDMMQGMVELDGDMDMLNSDHKWLDKKAGSFSLTDMDGNTVSFDAMRGKVVVINFWFIECKPCVEEIPDLNDLVEKYENEDVVFVGLAENDRASLEKFLAKNPFRYKITPNSSAVISEYGVFGFPSHMIIDKDGIVRYYTSGLMTGGLTVKGLDSEIGKLLRK